MPPSASVSVMPSGVGRRDRQRLQRQRLQALGGGAEAEGVGVGHRFVAQLHLADGFTVADGGELPVALQRGGFQQWQ